MDLSTLMPQQLEIVKTLDKPLFVSAGAGSGKTFTLTKRVLWALSPGSGPFIQSIDQVLAITFTNKAAAELRERIRGALIDEGMMAEALKVDDAWISTIHGMCGRILRAHALELGIDPEFGIAGEDRAAELMDQALNHVLAELGDAREAYPHLLAQFRLRGGGGFGAQASAVSLARDLLEKAVGSVKGFDAVRMVKPELDLDALEDAYRAVLGAVSPASKGAETCAAALEALVAFGESDGTRADFLACAQRLGVPRAAGKAKPLIEALKAERGAAVLGGFLFYAYPAARELMDLVERLFRAYGALKREASLLDNSDLLRLAYDALVNHPAIAREYAGRFCLVMIDEFQDTAQQQVELIGRLISPDQRELCTVGDAKQSIYRFRGADVAVFRAQEQAILSGSGTGVRVSMARNFRSHAAVLDYVTQVFEERGDGWDIMPGYEALEPSPTRKDGLAAQGASRRQAVLVAGGRGDERCRVKAQAIAARFRRLADAGQDPAGMVILLGKMTNAGAYAEAVRAAGLPCVISGGSVFAGAPEVQVVEALLRFFANPLDAKEGLLPVLVSPLFELGAQELLAVVTDADGKGGTRRRNLDAVTYLAETLPAFGELPALKRACAVLKRAATDVGARPVSALAEEVVRASGWLERLARQGAEGEAVAANVLKALRLVRTVEEGRSSSPRQVATAFAAYLASAKESPGALTAADEGAGAVRIMTAHASKGLEFPVVAVADCFAIRSAASSLACLARGNSYEAVLAPAEFADDAERKLFADARKAVAADVEAGGEVVGGTAAGRFCELADENRALELEERARLLYVAMTRAREVLILALDARCAGKANKVSIPEKTDLTAAVLARILPEGARLDAGLLAYEGSQPGDFELRTLADVTYNGETYAQTDLRDGEGAGEKGGEPEADGATEAEAAAAAAQGASGEGGISDTAVEVVNAEGASEARGAVVEAAAEEGERSLLLAYPRDVALRVDPAGTPAPNAYSYTALARALKGATPEDKAAPAPADAVLAGASLEGAAGEDAALADALLAGAAEEGAAPIGGADEAAALSGSAADAVEEGASAALQADDPTALGSAFHALAQLMVETGEKPDEERIAAQERLWGASAAQAPRLRAALARWEGSAVRAEALAWPDRRAEVPFFCAGDARYGAYAEGSIDLLCTDPARPDAAFVVDYKTGGSPAETPEALREKHALQAQVYADALRQAGYAHVELAFVRVEVPDPENPAEPQVVRYRVPN